MISSQGHKRPKSERMIGTNRAIDKTQLSFNFLQKAIK